MLSRVVSPSGRQRRIGSRWRLFLGAFLASSCHSIEPGARDFAYNLELGAVIRDFPNQRYYDCHVTFELDVHVPLPDTFTTVADARVTRSVVQNAGGVLTTDTVVRNVTVQVTRLPRTASDVAAPDSLRVVLAGPITDTLGGVGTGGDEGRYDGGWTCATDLPPAPSAGLQAQGYPAGEIDPGQWFLFAIFPGD